MPMTADAQETPIIRWGIVGTGSISTNMAGVMSRVSHAQLVAVSSRRMSSAQAFASEHGIDSAYDSWAEMAGSDDIDAIYVGTPTGVREEIAIAAANAGKHVLAEKPFASLPSLQRIISACRANGVGFMDGNHFGHHPRTFAIRESMDETVGWPWSLNSTYMFGLTDRDNIRFSPGLEPMGAIGDVGWYCMRAIAEYRPQDLAIRSLSSYLRREPESTAVVAGSGVIQFEDGSTSTWNCSYDTGAVFTDLRISGANGVITLDDFPNNEPDGSGEYLHYRGGFDDTVGQQVVIESEYTSRELMFERFAAMTLDDDLLAKSIADSERTQSLLDSVWQSALENERAL